MTGFFSICYKSYANYAILLYTQFKKKYRELRSGAIKKEDI